MEKDRAYYLVTKFNEGSLTAAEIAEMETLIASGVIDLSAFSDLQNVEDKIFSMSDPEPSKALDQKFYEMLASSSVPRRSFSWDRFFTWTELAPRLAFAAFALIIGLAIGYFLRPSQADDQQLVALTEQVTDLKEMMMLSLLEKESATERLRAVSLTQDMDGASTKVTEALLKTLNQDENVNVRLAALDALKPYVRQSKVREALIRSIAEQESPLVLISLAELMAAIQEKSSVNELRKVIESERTPAEVKNRIKESIKVLS